MSRAGKPSAGRRSGRTAWLVPLAVFLATAGVTAAALAYLQSGRGLNLFERPAPTDSTEAVAVSIGEIGFHIPANYIAYASARRGGRRNELAMVALLPDLQGYSLADAAEFASGAPDSRVINFTLQEEQMTRSDQERLEQSFLPLVEDKNGFRGPYNLTQYRFRDNSGYDDSELFVGETPGGVVILRCEKEDGETSAPTCESITSVTAELSLTYTFHRAQMQQWRDVDAGVRALTGAFMDVVNQAPDIGDQNTPQ
jgi:hypothetical protein